MFAYYNYYFTVVICCISLSQTRIFDKFILLDFCGMYLAFMCVWYLCFVKSMCLNCGAGRRGSCLLQLIKIGLYQIKALLTSFCIRSALWHSLVMAYTGLSLLTNFFYCYFKLKVAMFKVLFNSLPWSSCIYIYFMSFQLTGKEWRQILEVS